jgi:hypothetical protein
MSTSVASNDKGEPWQTVDRSYGFAIFNDKDKEKFMPTRFYNTPVRTDMYVCASISYQVPGTSYLVPVLVLHNIIVSHNYHPV